MLTDIDDIEDDLPVGQVVFCVQNGAEFTGRIRGRYGVFYRVDRLTGSIWTVSPGNLYPISEEEFQAASKKIYNSRHV